MWSIRTDPRSEPWHKSVPGPQLTRTCCQTERSIVFSPQKTQKQQHRFKKSFSVKLNSGRMWAMRDFLLVSVELRVPSITRRNERTRPEISVPPPRRRGAVYSDPQITVIVYPSHVAGSLRRLLSFKRRFLRLFLSGQINPTRLRRLR